MAAEPIIAGIDEHRLRRAPEGYTALRFSAECARAAVADAGLGPDSIDGLCCAGDSMAANYVAEYLDLHPRWINATSVGGSSYLLHIAEAADAVRRGRCGAVLVTYGSTARSAAAALGSTPRAAGAVDPMGVEDAEAHLTPYGVTLAAQYALVASRHMAVHGTTRAQLAAIAVSTRYHASLNPDAVHRTPITVGDVIASRPIAEPLHLLDCCVVTDGGGAVVVARDDLVDPTRHRPVRILGGAHAVGHGEGGHRDLLEVAAWRSGPAAMGEAGIAPADVDLLMVYDSYTISVLSTIEALGFCARGEGGAFVENGRLRLDGALPTNTDGGALSSNHPGRRGIFLAIEATRQLRGEAAGRQVQDAAVAVCHGIGGYLGGRHSGVTLVLGAG